MFKEIIEYDNVLDEIKDYDLSRCQTDTLLTIIKENPTLTAPKLLEITKKLFDDEVIILDAGTYSADPILNENQSKELSLMEFVIPAITKHIPSEIIGYLTEVHATAIIDKILDIEFDKKTTPQQLRQRIDEMFGAGDISIPIQGLNRRRETAQLVLGTEFGQRLYKGIQFGKDQYNQPLKSQCANKNTLRYALKDYNFIDMEQETPLMKMLPKFIMVLKHMLGDK